MACAGTETNSFFTQAEAIRKRIKSNFAKSRNILDIKETALLSELDLLVGTYRGDGVRNQIQDLVELIRLLRISVKDNKNEATVTRSISLMDCEIKELEMNHRVEKDRMKSVELEWDTGIEEKLSQIGWIRMDYEEIVENKPDHLKEEYYLSSSDEDNDVAIVADEKLQEKKDEYKEKARKYKEELKRAISDLQDLTKECGEFKIKYKVVQENYAELLVLTEQVEKELGDLKKQQILSCTNRKSEPDNDGDFIEPFQSVSSLLDEINQSSAKHSLPPKSDYDKQPNFKPQYLLEKYGLERYNPLVLKQHIHGTSTLIYKRFSIKTINLSFLKNPDIHKEYQVFVKVKEMYRLGYLKVIFSKKLPYLSKTEMIAGIELQEPYGNSNGVYETVKHFNCLAKHAIFIPINEVFVPVF